MGKLPGSEAYDAAIAQAARQAQEQGITSQMQSAGVTVQDAQGPQTQELQTHGPQTGELNESGGYRLHNPMPQDQSRTENPAQAAREAGQALHDAGVREQRPGQSEAAKQDTQNRLDQNRLDRGGQSEQNSSSTSSRCADERSAAKAAPDSSEPSRGPDMER